MKKELCESLNKYLANAGVMYIKLHNLHWNVVGLNFKAVHEYLETLYDGFADVLDEIAEAIKMQGGYPLASMKDYLGATGISEIESKEYTVKDTLTTVYADIKLMTQQAEAIRKEAGDDDNYPITTMLESHLENFNKTLWFLDSMMK
ncbi:MAG: DNA starvation/stationary phase protection protein [Spirochaetales bacterium]